VKLHLPLILLELSMLKNEHIALSIFYDLIR
jgi:hypothetical protein